MAWRNLPQLAGLLSQYYHAGQVDKAGKKYWKHPKRVAKLVQEFPGFARFSPHEQEVAVCAAFLHDVIEDCDVSPQELTAHGFSPDIETKTGSARSGHLSFKADIAQIL
jgi:(p)ppGpp synthase/HD superfamily hydrolase